MVINIAERRGQPSSGYDAGWRHDAPAPDDLMPPANVEAEAELLGALIAYDGIAVDVLQILRPADFFRPEHARIYAVVVKLTGDGLAVNPISVERLLEDAGKVDERSMVFRLTERPLHGELVVSVARSVAEYAHQRRMWAKLSGISRTVLKGSPTDAMRAMRDALVDLERIAPPHMRPVAITSFNSFTAEGGVSETGPLPRVPSFPVSVIPEPLATLIRQGMGAIGCPGGLVANPALATAAGVIGNRFRLRVKNGWEELPNLWPVVVADPGSAKTPAANVARRPVEILQREAFDLHAKAVQLYEQALEVWEAAERKTRGEKPQEPAPMEHYYTDDATTESLARILGTQPSGAASPTPGLTASRDELVGWVNGFDAYRGGKGGDRQTWLTMWAGRDAKIDRAGAGTTLIREPVVPVTGSIQPDLLPQLAGDAKRDGFVERFLFSFEDAPPSGWQWEEVQTASVEAVSGLYRRIRWVQGQHVVDLSTEARTRFAEWMEHENKPRQYHVAGMLQGICAKLPSQVARLTLVLHCLKHGESAATVAVPVATVENAIILGDYYLAHAIKVLARFGPAALSGSGLAGRIVKALQDATAQRLKRVDLHRALGRSVKAGALDAALEELMRLTLVQECPGERSGPGRPSMFYEIPPSAVNELNEVIPLAEACADCGGAVDQFGEDGIGRCDACALLAQEARR